MFDHNATSSHFNQYCDSEDNVTCFHFTNGNSLLFFLTWLLFVIGFIAVAFIPVFRITDEATGRSSVYSGLYTLRLLAGGERLSQMTQYDSSV